MHDLKVGHLLDPHMHQAGTRFQRPDRITSPLYVVAVIFNPIRFRSRWKLYQDFAKRVDESGAKLFTVEAAFGQREFAIASPDDPLTLGVRVSQELWLKENLVNLGVQRLPPDWRYVAWVDADVAFARDDWADETRQQLQHHPVVQMWGQSIDLGPKHEPLNAAKSFAWCHVNHSPKPPASGGYYYYGQGKGSRGLWHPGYAWAMRRDAWDHVGGLIDFSIVGNGDNQMANGIVGTMAQAVHSSLIGSPYYRDLMLWQERAERYLKHDLGYVDGLLLHYWHGKKAQRQYKSRWQILVDSKYDPALDLKRDWQGAFQLTDRSEVLRDGLRYFGRARNEDSIDI